MNITVYLGALEGNDKSLLNAVRELGNWIGESGNALVYGGSKTGLMGELAESTLQAGGAVTGVEPEFLMEKDVQYEGLTKLIVKKDYVGAEGRNDCIGRCLCGFSGWHGDIGRDFGGHVQGVHETTGGTLYHLQSERLLQQPEGPFAAYDKDGTVLRRTTEGHFLCGKLRGHQEHSEEQVYSGK